MSNRAVNLWPMRFGRRNMYFTVQMISPLPIKLFRCSFHQGTAKETAQLWYISYLHKILRQHALFWRESEKIEKIRYYLHSFRTFSADMYHKMKNWVYILKERNKIEGIWSTLVFRQKQYFYVKSCGKSVTDAFRTEKYVLYGTDDISVTD